MIRPIDSQSIDKLTSGQVITSLGTAVKELVENSLDANATAIDVRIVNQGRDGVSVQDNGRGIEPSDFDNLVKKHATSKIGSFSDLETVRTLGFRGEALASLNAVAHVQVTTSTGTGTGHKLLFDKDGNVTEDTKTPSPRGTLVELDNIFERLPVRRKDFERNSQREFTKTVALMQEYALLHPVKLTVEHVVRNRRITTLRSQGADLLQRIACVYGAKRTKSLMKIDLGPSELSFDASLVGFISKPVFGMGDSSSTCQLIAVNGRPTRQQHLLKAIIDTYKQSNFTETPFLVLNLQLNPAAYDVNVSPEKRELLLHNEHQLIQNVSEALAAAFAEVAHSVPRGTQEPPSKKFKQSTISLSAFAGSGGVIDQDSQQKRSSSRRHLVENHIHMEEGDGDNEDEDEDEDEDDVWHSGDNIPKAALPVEAPERSPTIYVDVDMPLEDRNQHPDLTLVSAASSPEDSPHMSAAGSPLMLNVHSTVSGDVDVPKDCAADQKSTLISDALFDESSETRVAESTGISASKESSSPSSTARRSSSSLRHEVTETVAVEDAEYGESDMGEDHTCCAVSNHEAVHELVASPSVEHPLESPMSSPVRIAPKATIRPRAGQLQTLNTHIHLPLSIEDVKIAKERRDEKSQQSLKRLQNVQIDEEGAEDRLSLSIRKQDFENMKVVGQFNLGFILVVNHKPSHDDLFVIDQHASDEIYNFERLQNSTVLSRQPLLIPQPLELSAVEELTIQEHLSVFENNGFTISFNTNAPPGKQCLLESVPYSKNTVFDGRDIHELLGRIRDEPQNKALKCSKLRAMFAMRACRSSIMIGTALPHATMKKVVQHLGTLDKPWNCPHGRPTLRHITTLS